MAETARRAFRRVGLGANGAAIDCGCGPIGGLAVLAEIVGPAGRVVGVDFSEPAIQRARSAKAALGLPNVQLVAGDIHYLDRAPRPGTASGTCSGRIGTPRPRESEVIRDLPRLS
jgi:ubiquinone/menaquinone biosynthesis C-methylase UbiE